ncbi:MAG: hypothetical protein GY851_20895 [bacterium]|nr:hypothetical protein [bacterium]
MARPRTVSLQEILQDPLAFKGRRVKVRGRAAGLSFRYRIRRGKIVKTRMRGPICTLKGCSPKAPCCNGCHVDVSLSDTPATGGLTLVGKGYGCSGTNCGLECNPTTGVHYEVTGVISMRTEERTEIKLTVESIRRLR